MHLAAQNGHKLVVESLVTKQVDVNAVTKVIHLTFSYCCYNVSYT